ncbi:hypothetical protein ACO0RG_000734 [Hanseniaspora osmophila]
MSDHDLEHGKNAKNNTQSPSTPQYFSIPITNTQDNHGRSPASPSGHFHYEASSPGEEQESNARNHYGSIDIGQPSHRRPSIFEQPIGSFRGPNSLSRFASSFQRSNAFKTIDLHHDKERSYFKDGTDETFDPETLAPSMHGRRLSLLLNNSAINSPNGQLSGGFASDSLPSRSMANKPITVNDVLMHQPVFDDRDSTLSVAVSNNNLSAFPSNSRNQDVQSVILKKFETEQGTTVVTLAGQSTAPQTIFNSINVLIGIGLLALPLGLNYAGWYLGIPMLLIFAFSTFCTAELLSRCLSTDPTLISYGDLGYAAFGPRGRALISFLFTMDVLGAGVALFILFGDSLNALFPSHSVTFYKICGFFIICPQSFLPLHILSHVSLLGILSTTGTVFLIFVCGLSKASSPGSLLEPMVTNVWPANFTNFCLSIGLLSACWGGHAIFPNLRSDMRHPEKFKDCLKTTYLITSITDIGTAVLGFLMFGNGVLDEVTKSVLLTKGYPSFVYVLISALMSMIPIAKTPLNAMPIVSILDTVMGLRSNNHKDKEKEMLANADSAGNIARDIRSNDSSQDWLLSSSTSRPASVENRLLKIKQKVGGVFNRILVNVLFLLTSILYPQFDKLLAFIGAGLCFLICFILPCSFYLVICKNTIKTWEIIACYIVIFVSIILSVLGVGAAIVA